MLETKHLKCQIKDLGFIEYGQAYEIQKQCVDEILKGGPQTLLFCEHPTVLTMGRMSHEENILWPKEWLEANSIKVHYIDRGGDITLHSPGQLVVYPIFNLLNYEKDLHAYLHKLEKVAIDLLGDFGILANRFSEKTGVWVEDKKIASIGIGVRKWVSFHGLGINVNTDLNLFSAIRPCGLDVHMTSLAQIKGNPIDMDIVKKKIMEHFSMHFYLDVI